MFSLSFLHLQKMRRGQWRRTFWRRSSSSSRSAAIPTSWPSWDAARPRSPTTSSPNSWSTATSSTSSGNAERSVRFLGDPTFAPATIRCLSHIRHFRRGHRHFPSISLTTDPWVKTNGIKSDEKKCSWRWNQLFHPLLLSFFVFYWINKITIFTSIKLYSDCNVQGN